MLRSPIRAAGDAPGMPGRTRGVQRGSSVRGIVATVAAATSLALMACAPQEVQVNCPRPESVEQVLKSATVLAAFKDKRGPGFYLVNISPDSFWACAGIGEGDLITAFDSQTVSEGPAILELAARSARCRPCRL